MILNLTFRLFTCNLLDIVPYYVSVIREVNENDQYHVMQLTQEFSYAVNNVSNEFK